MDTRFLMSCEQELLTVAGDGDPRRPDLPLLRRFFDDLADVVPSLPGVRGAFTSYGRVYLDGTHLELAAAEADSPYTLVRMMDQQQAAVRLAAERRAADGEPMLLSNCNHAGLLTADAATWGSHENYWCPRLPTKEECQLLVPFFASRFYAGAGGIDVENGRHVASTRQTLLDVAKELFLTAVSPVSTPRRDHLNHDPGRYGYRFHLRLGDGQRSQFGRFIRFGVTALVLRAVLCRTARQAMSNAARKVSVGEYSSICRAWNHLGTVCEEPQVDFAAIAVQRAYLETVDDLVDRNDGFPPWTRHVLAAWDVTLSAAERRDTEWLAKRLDPWIKHQITDEWLAQHNLSRADMTNRDVACAVALLYQNYHRVDSLDTPWDELQDVGLLKDQVTNAPTIGDEPDPFVPEVATRARPRAAFLKAHRGERAISVDWTSMIDTSQDGCWLLSDPFANAVETVLP